MAYGLIVPGAVSDYPVVRINERFVLLKEELQFVATTIEYFPRATANKGLASSFSSKCLNLSRMLSRYVFIIFLFICDILRTEALNLSVYSVVAKLKIKYVAGLLFENFLALAYFMCGICHWKNTFARRFRKGGTQNFTGFSLCRICVWGDKERHNCVTLPL